MSKLLKRIRLLFHCHWWEYRVQKEGDGEPKYNSHYRRCSTCGRLQEWDEVRFMLPMSSGARVKWDWVDIQHRTAEFIKKKFYSKIPKKFKL